MPNYNFVHKKHNVIYHFYLSKKVYLKIMYVCVCVYDKPSLKDVSNEEFKYDFCQHV